MDLDAARQRASFLLSLAYRLWVALEGGLRLEFTDLLAPADPERLQAASWLLFNHARLEGLVARARSRRDFIDPLVMAALIDWQAFEQSRAQHLRL